MNDEEEDFGRRILAYMLYKGYVGDKTINQDLLIEDMKKDGFLDMDYIRILSLLKQKGLLKGEGKNDKGGNSSKEK